MHEVSLKAQTLLCGIVALCYQIDIDVTKQGATTPHSNVRLA